MNLHTIHTGFRRKVPVILQTEIAECGLACLAMVLCHYGRLVDLVSIRRETSVSGTGLNLRALMKIASRYGLHCRPVRLELDDLSKLSRPCVLHWDFNHFVVLTKVTDSGIVINDPARGERKVALEEVSRHFTGVALELTPETKFEKKDDRSLLKVRDMFRHIVGLKTVLWTLGGLSLGLEALALINPMLGQVVVDEVLTTGDKSLLWTIAAGMLILVVIQGVISTFRTWLVMIFSTRISLQWNVSLFTHLLSLPQDFFAKRGAGDIISRFGSLGAIQHTFTTDLVQSVLDGIMAIGMLVMIIIYGKWMAALVAITVLVDLVVRFIQYGPYKEMSEETLVHSAAQQGHFIETLRGIRSIKLMGLQRRRTVVWTNRMIDNINAGLRIQRYDLIFARAQEILIALDKVATLVLGARMVMSGGMSIGMLMAFMSYRDQFCGRVGSLIGVAFKIKNLKVQCDRLSDIALAEAEGSEADSPVSDTAGLVDDDGMENPDVPMLECRNLGYRYGKEDTWVFRHLNLKVYPGKSLAIVGPSGCGKSTLLGLLMGLIQPEEGQIFWKGMELKAANREAYRARIAGVLQDDILFSGSIAENISGFDDEMDLEWVAECARNAQIHEDIQRMPMGLETIVGEMGSTLSGGQRQRLILARALYQAPRILFLDEATSNLDPASEQAVEAVLNELPITRVVVTHRPGTAERADGIFVMGVSAEMMANLSQGGDAPASPVAGAASPSPA